MVSPHTHFPLFSLNSCRYMKETQEQKNYQNSCFTFMLSHVEINVDILRDSLLPMQFWLARFDWVLMAFPNSTPIKTNIGDISFDWGFPLNVSERSAVFFLSLGDFAIVRASWSVYVHRPGWYSLLLLLHVLWFIWLAARWVCLYQHRHSQEGDAFIALWR